MPIWYPVPSALVGFLDVGHHFFFVGRYLAVDQRRRLGYKPDFKAASSDLKYWNPRQVNFSFTIESQKPKK
ncbi:hypothetical protein RhiirC2_793403 [Rhizophagus irregularis]|uniref:Uncharacterized protein n=1 Tax=Rhizophagus irregularis TaxID=588596 RepID=A0A2N1MFG4_9GLOM|nr:hypothetical protein RhiirC2_793403 [Rhizophagus irregularis]